MASDEAVVRVVLQDTGGVRGRTDPAADAPPSKSAQVETTPPLSLQVPPAVLAVMDRLARALEQLPDLSAATQGIGRDSAGTYQPPTVEQPPIPPPPVPPPAPPADTSISEEDRKWIDDLVNGIEGANRHVLLEGQSGSGKSLLTRHIAFQRMEQGEDVHVVDTHNPEAWGGAKQVFQGQAAGQEAAKFMLDLLQQRKGEASEAKTRGELPDFKPVTIVLSDFARLMRDTPQLREEFKTLLTEARKFRISIVADTTALTGASSGIKGIQDVLQNFGQKVKLYAPTAEDPQRRARLGGTGGEVVPVPKLPDYAERRDLSLVKPPEDTALDVPVGPAAAARRKFDMEEYQKEVQAEYEKLRAKENAAKEEERIEQEKADSHARLLAEVARLDRQAAVESNKRLMERVKELDILAAEEEKKYREEKKREQDAADSHARLLLKVAELDRAAEAEKQAALEKTPAYQARQRREKELERERADAEYERMYGEKEDTSTLGSFLKVAEGLRGTIGGHLGSLIGSGLDVSAAMKKSPLFKPSVEATVQPTRAGDEMLPIADKAPGGGASAGGMMGMAAEAMPIIAVASLAKEVSEAISAAVMGGIHATVGAVSGVANFAASANSDPSVPIGQLGDAASKAGEQVAKVVPALGWMITAAGESAKALSSFMQAVDQTAEKYGEYSAEIAQAQGISEIRQTMGALRRAQEVGPEIARYIEARSDLQAKFEDIKIKLLVKILPAVTRILEVLEAIMPSGKGIEDAIGQLTDPIGTLANAAAELVGLKRDEKLPDIKDPTELLLHDTKFGLTTSEGGFVPDR